MSKVRDALSTHKKENYWINEQTNEWMNEWMNINWKLIKIARERERERKKEWNKRLKEICRRKGKDLIKKKSIYIYKEKNRRYNLFTSYAPIGTHLKALDRDLVHLASLWPVIGTYDREITKREVVDCVCVCLMSHTCTHTKNLAKTYKQIESFLIPFAFTRNGDGNLRTHTHTHKSFIQIPFGLWP